MKRKRDASESLTTADLVVLSLVAEKPMHGYEINAELQRREVKDWAGISKPQIYYSLRKLESLKFVRTTGAAEDSLGPERQTFVPTNNGLNALTASLERQDWAVQRPPPPFLTWLVLSIHAKPGSVKKIINTRETFLKEQIKKETDTLDAIRADSGPTIQIAELIVDLAIKQFKVELSWLAEVRKRLRTELNCIPRYCRKL